MVVAVQPARHDEAAVDGVAGTGGQRAVVRQAGQHDVVAVADHRVHAEDHPVHPGAGGGGQRADVGHRPGQRHRVAAALSVGCHHVVHCQVRVGLERHRLVDGGVVVVLVALRDQRSASGVLIDADDHPQIAGAAQTIGQPHAESSLHAGPGGQGRPIGSHRVIGDIDIDQILAGGVVDHLHPVEPALGRGRVAVVGQRPSQVEQVARHRGGVEHLQIADLQVGRAGDLQRRAVVDLAGVGRVVLGHVAERVGADGDLEHAHGLATPRPAEAELAVQPAACRHSGLQISHAGDLVQQHLASGQVAHHHVVRPRAGGGAVAAVGHAPAHGGLVAGGQVGGWGQHQVLHRQIGVGQQHRLDRHLAGVVVLARGTGLGHRVDHVGDHDHRQGTGSACARRQLHRGATGTLRA